MPGPLSAPNGKYTLVGRDPRKSSNVRTGKTEVQRAKGKATHKGNKVVMTRAKREKLEGA